MGEKKSRQRGVGHERSGVEELSDESEKQRAEQFREGRKKIAKSFKKAHTHLPSLPKH